MAERFAVPDEERDEARFILAAFLMDYHGGQWSRGYRLLCRLGASNFSSTTMAELRDTETYRHLVSAYAGTV